jgi:hypothetical protein
VETGWTRKATVKESSLIFFAMTPVKTPLTKIGDYEVHPAAALFPMLSADEMKELAADSGKSSMTPIPFNSLATADVDSRIALLREIPDYLLAFQSEEALRMFGVNCFLAGMAAGMEQAKAVFAAIPDSQVKEGK